MEKFLKKLLLVLTGLYVVGAVTVLLVDKVRSTVQGPGIKLTAGPVQPTTVANNPWFKVATWDIDPANSTGCASDQNDCQRSSCGGTGQGPCLTFNGGIIARWGTYQPRLQQQTTITWISSQSGTGDAVKLQPYIESGGQLIILGTATTAATVTINGATFQAKSYGSNHELQANLTASGAEGQFLNNQTHASVAWSYKQVSGNIYAISQPLNPNATPASVYPVPEVDTWASTDSVKLQTFPLVDLVDLEPQSDDSQGVAPCVVAGVTVMAPNATIGSDSFTVGPNVTLQSMRSLKTLNVVDPNVGSLAFADASAGIPVPATVCLNCALEGGVTVNGGSIPFEGLGPIFGMVGGYMHSPAFGQHTGTTTLVATSLDGDVIVAGGPIDGGTGAVFINGGSLGLVDIQGVISAVGSVTMNGNYSGGNNSGQTLWGGGEYIVASGQLQYNFGGNSLTAVNTFLLAGGLGLGGGSTACSVGVGPGPAAWNCGITITPAAIDAPVGASGFGGLATDGAGSAIVNAATRN